MIETRDLDLEKVVLVGVLLPKDTEAFLDEYLSELTLLTQTAHGRVVKIFKQKLERVNPKTFIGTGKLNDIAHFVKEEKIDTVIFDDELSPTQLRNIESTLECKILDRTNLILDIFAMRATTSYARTQVELAQYEYILPRLVGMWTHLQKQKGGIGMKGPGETEIETDRRIIRTKISLLKDKLKTIDKQMNTQRHSRGKFIRVALVGYTNVGKSTLMNAMTKSEVLAENKLFATLDTTTRKAVVHNRAFLLSDTVGFIRKLPTQLVESFKSTLDEVREADLLIHMVDISNPSFRDQETSVLETIEDLGVSDKPIVTVYNKIDQFQNTYRDEYDLSEPTPDQYSLDDWKTLLSKEKPYNHFISVTEKQAIAELREELYGLIGKLYRAKYPYAHDIFQYYDQDGNPTDQPT